MVLERVRSQYSDNNYLLGRYCLLFRQLEFCFMKLRCSNSLVCTNLRQLASQLILSLHMQSLVGTVSSVELPVDSSTPCRKAQLVRHHEFSQRNTCLQGKA